jgi:hypothetical protein
VNALPPLLPLSKLAFDAGTTIAATRLLTTIE